MQDIIFELIKNIVKNLTSLIIIKYNNFEYLILLID